MSGYMKQGKKEWDLGNGIKAPIREHGGAAVLKEAKGQTVGINGMAGIGKNGLPIKGGK